MIPDGKCEGLTCLEKFKGLSSSYFLGSEFENLLFLTALLETQNEY
jgi:hypothetical protein